MENTKVCCKTCYYWKPFFSNNNIGKCRCFPPFNSAQTITSEHDWCGEWRSINFVEEYINYLLNQLD